MSDNRNCNINRNRFTGWFFKHQVGNRTVSFIPGHAGEDNFIQVITDKISRGYKIHRFYISNGIHADKCYFGKKGISIDLPGITGTLRYGLFERPDGDIMGPLRYFPTECRHGVISMGHTLTGSLNVDGETIGFGGGRGYIETDSGRSFPSEYLWFQCNQFPEECSVMAAVAAIPLLCVEFLGCVCVIIYKKKEYRIATYRGAKIIASAKDHIILKQGKTLFEIETFANKPGSVKSRVLQAPEHGRMIRTIREANNVTARVRLWQNDIKIFDLTSDKASFEYNF